jgi:hypothetical protein
MQGEPTRSLVWRRYDHLGQLFEGFYCKLSVETDCRFVLCERDADEWIERMRSKGKTNTSRVAIKLMRRGDLSHIAFRRLIKFGTVAFDERTWHQRYVDHVASVTRWFDQKSMRGRLLRLDLFSGDGWDKLCRFVGRSVPPWHEFPNKSRGHIKEKNNP